MPTRLLLALALLLPLAAPLRSQDEGLDDKVRTLLNEGMDFYKRGKYEESYSKFEEAFQMSPGSDLVYAFLKRAGEDVVAGMMNAPDENMRNTGARLLALAKPGEPLREGKDIVLGYIKDLGSDSFAVSENAFWHLKNYGAWAVRFLIPELATENSDRQRARLVRLLTEIGSEAVPAVAEALQAKSATLRKQAAIVLGNVRDDRALPSLVRAYENAEEDAEVKKLVHEAIQKVTRVPDAASWRPAKEYYYRLAENYYYSHPTVVHSWERYNIVWKWDVENDRLTERKVARFAYNEQMAEEALFDALAIDPSYVDPQKGESAWSLLVMAYFQQVAEARTGVEAALESLVLGEITEAQLLSVLRDLEGYLDASMKPLADQVMAAGSAVEKQSVLNRYLASEARVTRAGVLARIPGKVYVYEALHRSLKDGNAAVAQACLEAIRHMGRAEDLPSSSFTGGGGNELEELERALQGAASGGGEGGTVGMPLVGALAHEDKRVRYAAAETMAAINPDSSKLGMELVVPLLVDALGEQGVRVALVIYDVQDEADHQFVNTLKKTLMKLGVFPVVARSMSEGAYKAKTFPTEDVIIVQRKLASQVYFKESHVRTPVVETLFDALRNDVSTRNTPRVILCDGKSIRGEEAGNRVEKEFAEAKQQFEATAQGFLRPDTHELDLKELLDRLFHTDEAKKDAKDRADEIARDAAEALASIDPVHTQYPLRDSVEALVRTVSPETLREDFIRTPAARALGRIGDPRAVEVLAKVLEDKADDAERASKQKALRWEAARALSEIFRQTAMTPPDPVFQALKKYTRDGDYDIEMAAGEALGNATLTNEQRLELEQFRRIPRETYTADDP